MTSEERFSFNLIEFSPVIQEALEKSQLLTSGATQASSVASRGGSISLSAAVSGIIFSQIKYLNISYSGELQVALHTWLPSFVSLGLTPDMPNSMISKIPNHHVPYVFEKYDVPSSFLRNFWESLGIVIFVAVLWVLFHGIELIVDPRGRPKMTSFIRKARIIVQNFLFMVLYGVYGDLVMFSIVEYRTFVFGWNLSLLSFLISITMLIAMFLSFWYQTRLLINYQKIKKQGSGLEEFTKNHEGSQVIFKDFKDYSIAPQLFLFFLSGRDLLCSLVLATMFEYPLPQTIIITILDFLMIAYLFIKKPFRNTFEFTQQLSFEFTGIVVNVSVFINAILDAGKYEALGTRNNIGKLVIIANMIFNFVTAVFMLISLGQALLEFYREQKQKRAKIFRTLSIQNRPHEIKNKPTLDSNQSFLYDSSMSITSHNLTSGAISLQPESAGLNLLPQQISSSKRHQRPRKNLNYINESRHISPSPQNQETSGHSTHLQVESNNNYSLAKQRRVNKNSDSLRGSITYNPTEKPHRNDQDVVPEKRSYY